MSVLIYKQRFYQPNIAKSHDNNYYYIRYIATRDGVELNDKSNHGLWGKVGTNKLVEFESWEEIASRVRYLSSKGVNIYRSVISFSSETAKEMGLESNKDWQDYIKSKIYIMARENGIDALNLEYCVAHHDKENQHVHIAFWDKEQKISKNFVNPDLVDNLRKKLIKSTFKHELEKYYEAKNISKKEIKEITKENLEEFSELLKAYHKKKNPDFEFQRKGVENTSFLKQEEIRDKYLEIIELLPKKGSIDYKYLDEECKTKVDELVDLFVTGYEPLKISYDRYLKSIFDISSLYAKDEKLDEMLKTGEKEIKKYIANTILSSYRTFLKDKKELENKDRYDSIYMSREKKEAFAVMHLTDRVIQDIGFSLSTLFDGLSAERNNQNVHNFISKELSIFARRELRAKNRDRDDKHYQVSDLERENKEVIMLDMKKQQQDPCYEESLKDFRKLCDAYLKELGYTSVDQIKGKASLDFYEEIEKRQQKLKKDRSENYLTIKELHAKYTDYDEDERKRKILSQIEEEYMKEKGYNDIRELNHMSKDWEDYKYTKLKEYSY